MNRFLFAAASLLALASCLEAQDWIARNPSPHGEEFISMIRKGDSLLASTYWSGTCSFSSDRGKSWEMRRNVNIPSGGVLGYASDTSIIISQRCGAIARTTDWGKTWSVIRLRWDVSITLAIHFFDEKEGLLIAPNQNDSLFIARTTDGGVTWDEQRMKFGGVRVLSTSLLLDGNLFMGGYHPGPHLIFSDNRFRTWSDISTLPPDIDYIAATSFHDRSTGVIYTDKGWYRTADSCRTWNQVTASATVRDASRIRLDPRSGIGYIVHGNNSTALSRTTDAGASWTPVLTGVPDGSSVEGVLILDSLTALAYGAAGTIYRTTDAGVTWSRTHGFGPTTDLYSIHFADSLRGAAVSIGSGYVTTTDGGISWTAQTLPDNMKFVAVDYRGALGYCLARGSSGGYFLLGTSDGGQTWARKTQIPVKNYWGVGTGRPKGVACAGNGQAWISADGGTMYNTSDDGATWEAHYIFPVSGATAAVAAVDLGHAWYAQDNIVSRTRDTLRSFSIHDPATIAENIPAIHDIYFADSLRGWICGDWPQFSHPNASFMMRTTDGGRNWTQVAGVYGSEFTWKDRDNAVSYSGGRFGYDAGEPIRVTENAWSTWSDYLFWSVDIIGYGIRDTRSVWAVGWGGRIYELKR